MLKKRLVWLLYLLMIYRFGMYIPIPGIDITTLDNVIKDQVGALGILHSLIGGMINQVSIFTLNIIPYITASIIIQLLTFMFKDFDKYSEDKKRKKSFYIKCVAIFLSLLQGYNVASGIELLEYKSIPLVNYPGIKFKASAMLNFTLGTMITIWIVEQINLKSFGNGNSVIIFSSIISGIIPSIITFIIKTLLKKNYLFCIITSVIFAATILVLIIVVEGSQRKLLIQYPQKQTKKQLYINNITTMPLKINLSGVAAPIFANTLLLFPSTISELIMGKNISVIHNEVTHMIFYILLITLFCFFYNIIVFNTYNLSRNLNKSNAIVISKRPGENTKSYLQYLIYRITCIGATYIGVICLSPEVYSYKYNIPIFFGGTSILILANIILEFSFQAQSQLLSNKYLYINKDMI